MVVVLHQLGWQKALPPSDAFLAWQRRLGLIGEGDGPLEALLPPVLEEEEEEYIGEPELNDEDDVVRRDAPPRPPLSCPQKCARQHVLGTCPNIRAAMMCVSSAVFASA